MFLHQANFYTRWGFQGKKSEQCCMKMWSRFVVELVSLSWLSDTLEEHKHGQDPKSTITAPHVPSVPFTAGEILSLSNASVDIEFGVMCVHVCICLRLVNECEVHEKALRVKTCL